MDTQVMDRANPSQASAESTSETSRKNVDAVTFIRAYNSSKSYEEVAEKTGLNPQSVKARAAQYRKKNIELRDFPRKPSRRALDIDALNAVAKATLAESEAGASQSE